MFVAGLFRSLLIKTVVDSYFASASTKILNPP